MRAALLQPDRPGQGRRDRSAAHRRLRVRGRRAVLPDLLRLRRHPHRGLRLREGAPGGLGRVRRDGVRLVHGVGGRPVAAGRRLAQPGGLRDHLRRDPAHRARLPARVLGRRVRQCLRARTHEGVVGRAGALAAHDRLDRHRAGRRLADLLPGGVLRRVERCAAAHGDGLELPAQGALGRSSRCPSPTGSWPGSSGWRARTTTTGAPTSTRSR